MITNNVFVNITYLCNCKEINNMIQLTEKAAKYAAEKSNEVIANALAKAYEEGYRDGYKDREEEIPIDLRDNKTEYVDLGLPSGTLWAKDYETENDNTLNLPYIKAGGLNLPTEEQWKELCEICKWQGDYSSSGLACYGISFIGPNGNSLRFGSRGFMKDNIELGRPQYGGGSVFFWLKDDEVTNDKKSVNIEKGKCRFPEIEIIRTFSGYKLPIRLVKAK